MKFTFLIGKCAVCGTNTALQAQVARLRDALERFAKIDLTRPIGDELAWDILNARAALKGGEE